MNTIRLVTALLDTKISFAEIPYFRGSMIRLSGGNPLFHNHHASGFFYHYPLVQYKRVDGCAGLVGINEGGELLMRMLEKETTPLLKLGNRRALRKTVTIRSERMSLVCSQDYHTYAISNWLPLNAENYRAYQQAEALSERISLLEHILVGNILSFAKGVGVFFDNPVECRLVQLEPSGLKSYKEVELMSFSAKFYCNVTLPDFIGLGKSVSLGHGMVRRIG